MRLIRSYLRLFGFENGVSSFTRILQSLYGIVLAALEIQSDVSNFFEIALGIKQGEPLSPLLLILFIYDVCSDLRNVDKDGEITGICINHICFFYCFSQTTWFCSPRPQQSFRSYLVSYRSIPLSGDFV